jgi:hypothetical protein
MSANGTEPAAGAGRPAFLRFSRDAAAGAAAARVRALESEIVLLREDNARLRVAAQRPATAGALLDLLTALELDGELDDDSARLVTELVVVHQTLDVVCAELERSVGAVRAKLAALAPRPGAALADGGGPAGIRREPVE